MNTLPNNIYYESLKDNKLYKLDLTTICTVARRVLIHWKTAASDKHIIMKSINKWRFTFEFWLLLYFLNSLLIFKFP